MNKRNPSPASTLRRLEQAAGIGQVLRHGNGHRHQAIDELRRHPARGFIVSDIAMNMEEYLALEAELDGQAHQLTLSELRPFSGS